MVDTRYVSIPLQSRLYRRLIEDRAAYIFAQGSFFSDFNICDVAEDDPPEWLEDTLEEFIDNYPDVFHTQEQTKRLIDEFKAEVEKITIKSTSFESTESLVRERLITAFDESQSDSVELIGTMFDGEQNFDPQQFYSSNYSEFSLISLPIVQAGAELLRDIIPESLFNVSEGWSANNPCIAEETNEDYFAWDFWRWKNLYLKAAQSQSVIFVGRC